TNEDGLARLAERGLDLHLVAVGEELIEAGTSDDPDVRDRSHGRQATFSPEEPAEDVPAVDVDEDFSPPVPDEEDESFDDDSEDDESFADPPSAEDGEAAAAGLPADPFLLSLR